MPGQVGAARQQGGLVGLDDKQVVRVLVGDQELGGQGVGVQGVRRDDSVGKVEVLEQRDEGADLAGAPSTWRWASTARVVWSIAASRWTWRPAGGQRAPRKVLPSTATTRCRCRGPGAGPGGSRSRSPSASQAPITVASATGSTRASVRRMVASAGTAHRSGPIRRAPSAARTGGGLSAAHSAIAVIDRAPASTAA